MPRTLNEHADYFHKVSFDAGWWKELSTTSPQLICAVKIALIHSEISEALEGLRKNLFDSHLPHRKSVEVELADALIRIFDLAGFLKLDLDGATWEKDEYNHSRLDHKPENRSQEGGKKF
jgi:NTP pyrophosphatase (non-canonical NTP hydrolase)